MASRSKMWAYIVITVAISFSHEIEASNLNWTQLPNTSKDRSHVKINPAAAFWAAVFVALGILLFLCWFCQGEQPQEEMEPQPQSQEELESQPQSQEMDPPLNDLVEPPAIELVEAEQVPNQAASQSFFESFPTATWQPHSAIGFGATQCRVCLEELVEGDAVRILPACGHIFHIHCIDSWLSKTTTCPICRYFYS